MPMAGFRETLRSGHFLVVAHRGASAYAPENTVEGFDAACALGADAIELDVHLTRDGEVVVMHDDRVDRTTDGAGAIATKTWSEIQTLDAGAWFGERFRGARVPTLADVLGRFAQRVLIDIELKTGVRVAWPDVAEDAAASTGLARRVLEVVERAGASSRVIVSAAGPRALRWIREAAPGVAVQWSVFALDIGRDVAWAADEGFDVISPQDYAATEANIAAAHARGLAVHIYTAGDEGRMARLIELGADAVKTARPDRLRETAVRLGRGSPWRAGTA
jgi:glycerophosphoryl diester phosphodiesterase